MAPLRSDAIQVPPPRLCSYLLFYVVLLSLFTHITSALITYDKGTLLDIGHRYTNLFQDTLSSNPSWPLEILQNVKENNGHLNNPRRRRIKSTAVNGDPNRNREKGLAVLLYRASCSLMSNPWRIRWTILEPG